MVFFFWRINDIKKAEVIVLQKTKRTDWSNGHPRFFLPIFFHPKLFDSFRFLRPDFISFSLLFGSQGRSLFPFHRFFEGWMATGVEEGAVVVLFLFLNQKKPSWSSFFGGGFPFSPHSWSQDYAILSGGNILGLKEEAVPELRRVFRWARRPSLTFLRWRYSPLVGIWTPGLIWPFCWWCFAGGLLPKRQGQTFLESGHCLRPFMAAF